MHTDSDPMIGLDSTEAGAIAYHQLFINVRVGIFPVKVKGVFPFG